MTLRVQPSSQMIGATIGVVIAAGFGQYYRSYKYRRRQRTYAERNAGFWTDRRLVRVEAAACTLLAGMPMMIIIPVVVFSQPIWAGYLATLSYPMLIWLLMLGLNAHSDEQGNFSAEEAAETRPPSVRRTSSDAGSAYRQGERQNQDDLAAFE